MVFCEECLYRDTCKKRNELYEVKNDIYIRVACEIGKKKESKTCL